MMRGVISVPVRLCVMLELWLLIALVKVSVVEGTILSLLRFFQISPLSVRSTYHAYSSPTGVMSASGNPYVCAVWGLCRSQTL